jgi:hypothetical protein
MKTNDLYNISINGLKPYFSITRGDACEVYTMNHSIHVIKIDRNSGFIEGNPNVLISMNPIELVKPIKHETIKISPI